MALIPIGPWKRDSTYRVHPLGLRDFTYRVPLLDSKLVRLCYAWYYRIKSPSGPSSALTALGMPQPSFWTLNAVEPCLTYPNLYLEVLTCDLCNQPMFSELWSLLTILIFNISRLLSLQCILFNATLFLVVYVLVFVFSSEQIGRSGHRHRGHVQCRGGVTVLSVCDCRWVAAMRAAHRQLSIHLDFIFVCH